MGFFRTSAGVFFGGLFGVSLEGRAAGSSRRTAAGAALLLGALSACATGPAPQRYRQNRLLDVGATRFRESDLNASPFTIDTHFGIRSMDDDARWGDLDRQTEIGINFLTPLLLDDPAVIEDTRTGFLSFLSYDLGLRYAFDSSETTVGADTARSLESQTFDIHAGLMLSPFQYTSRFQPYLGGGLAFAFIDTDLTLSGSVQNDRDSVLTSYVRTGARVELDFGRHVGLDVRWLNNADVRIDGLGADVGALSVSITFGASF